MTYVNAIIISDLVPNIDGIEALVISDGEHILLTLKHGEDGVTIKGPTVSEIQLDREDVERLLMLLDNPS